MHTHPQLGVRPGWFRGRAAQLYDVMAQRVFRGLYRRIAEDIVDAAPDHGSVLDVGTGPGLLLTEIGQCRPDLCLTGVDVSADMVANAERNLARFGERASAHLGSSTELPFPDGGFDLVVTSFSLHHWADPAAAPPELARVLRPGGRLYVYDFRHAPFETLAESARAKSLFTGQAMRRTTIHTGVPYFPRCVRHVMTVARK